MEILEPVSANKGLWANPAWKAGDAGLFAVIIGVSRYAHLQGGSAPASDTYDLGQLPVSALTAFRVFEWLDSAYHLNRCPVAKCWFLASATTEELQFEPRLGHHVPEATHDNCKRAIQEWFHEMSQLSAQAGHDSRSLLFFSGHGLEIHHEQQILLPADYLAPPAQNVNGAISTQNLRIGVSTLPVPQHFLFVDACRNDCQRLRNQRVEGERILNEHVAAHSLPEMLVPVLYSTTSGQQSYEPLTPADGISLYGQALVDGLLGTPDIDLKPDGAFDLVHLYALQGYVKARVSEQIAKFGGTFVQPVRLGGSVDNVCVTSIERTRRAAVEPNRFEEYQAMEGRYFTVSTHVDFEHRLKGWPADYSTSIRDVFGSEQSTELFSKARLFPMEQQRWIDSTSLLIVGVDRTEDRRSHRVHFEILNPDRIGHWVQLIDAKQGTFGCLLPADVSLPPLKPARVVYSIELDRVNGRITRLDAGLSAHGSGQIADAARLWRRYQIADIQAALTQFDTGHLKKLIAEKEISSLSATVAAQVLLRTNRNFDINAWLRNLANWYPRWPDGAVLSALYIMRFERARLGSLLEAATYLSQLEERGMPRTSEALSYAASAANELLNGGVQFPSELLSSLVKVQSQLTRALSLFRPGGLFVTYSGFAPDLKPTDIVRA